MWGYPVLLFFNVFHRDLWVQACPNYCSDVLDGVTVWLEQITRAGCFDVKKSRLFQTLLGGSYLLNQFVLGGSMRFPPPNSASFAFVLLADIDIMPFVSVPDTPRQPKKQ